MVRKRGWLPALCIFEVKKEKLNEIWCKAEAEVANQVDHDLMALVKDLFSEYDECEKTEALELEKKDDQWEDWDQTIYSKENDNGSHQKR